MSVASPYDGRGGGTKSKGARVTSVRERNRLQPPDLATLEAHRRDLSRGVLSLICSTTGRGRTPDERARLDALVREIERVRTDMRNRRLGG
jgi:hypothetical protein